MHKYKVSIIIPTYNREQLVSLAISSVLNQSYEYLELIVVDDGSTDHTEAVMGPFSSDNRVKYIPLATNKGRSAARNIGIEYISGDFVMFLDSDDYLEPEAIERLIGLREKYPQINIFAGGYRLFEIKGNKKYTIYTRGRDSFIQNMFLEEIKEMVLNIGNHILHVDLIRKGIRFNENLDFAEDWEFLLNAIRGEQAVIIKETVRNVYRHNDNSAFEEIQRSIINVSQRYIHKLDNEGPSAIDEIYIDNFKLRLLMAYNRSGNKLKALKCLFNLWSSDSIGKKSWIRELLFLPIPSSFLVFFRNLQLKLKTYLNLVCNK